MLRMTHMHYSFILSQMVGQTLVRSIIMYTIDLFVRSNRGLTMPENKNAEYLEFASGVCVERNVFCIAATLLMTWLTSS